MNKMRRYDRIMLMLEQGYTAETIAAMFQTEVETIRAYELVRTGKDFKFALSTLDDSIYMQGKLYHVTEEEEKKMVELHSLGFPVYAIAKKMHRAEGTVGDVLRTAYGVSSLAQYKFADFDTKYTDAILKLHQPGKFGPNSIAKALGLDEANVRRVLAKHAHRAKMEAAKNVQKTDVDGEKRSAAYGGMSKDSQQRV